MKNLIIIFVSLITISCSAPKENMLVGKWQAIELLEGDMPVDIDIEVVQFHFDQNNQYQFHGTLNYKEAGTYYLDSRYLFTTDTINQATTEKAVEITRLTEDSLSIKMNDSGKERIMKLVKVD
jgi:hypothetical protein